MATAYWSLGRMLGLPLRAVSSSANLKNSYDTHVTVEVWLESLGRWVISDPTFGGYWSYGDDPTPIGVHEIQRLLLERNLDSVFWHSDGGPGSIRPSDYYMNPLDLYRYWAVSGFSSNGWGYLLQHETDIALFVPGESVYLLSADVDLARTRPDSTFPVRRLVVTEAERASAAGRAGGELLYVDRELFRSSIHLEPDRPLELSLPFSGVGVVVIREPLDHVAIETGGRSYEMAIAESTTISPVISVERSLSLRASSSRLAQLELVVFGVRRFPRDHEM